MRGILKIAYKLLVNDKGKFAALLVGITFAVFLMVMMTSMFAGILYRSSATVLNVGAKIWVMDPAVNTPANSIPTPAYVLDAVRSINGVKYAVPLYSGGALVKIHMGQVIGKRLPRIGIPAHIPQAGHPLADRDPSVGRVLTHDLADPTMDRDILGWQWRQRHVGVARGASGSRQRGR